jgi:hypothetical protein
LDEVERGGRAVERRQPVEERARLDPAARVGGRREQRRATERRGARGDLGGARGQEAERPGHPGVVGAERHLPVSPRDDERAGRPVEPAPPQPGAQRAQRGIERRTGVAQARDAVQRELDLDRGAAGLDGAREEVAEGVEVGDGLEPVARSRHRLVGRRHPG